MEWKSWVFFHWTPVSKIWKVQNLFLAIILTLTPLNQILLHSAKAIFLLRSNNLDNELLQTSVEIFRLKSSNRENRMLQTSASIRSIYRNHSSSTQTCLGRLKNETGPWTARHSIFLLFHRRGYPKRKKANFVTLYDWTLSSTPTARHVYNVGSINDSGINGKKCARRNGRKLRSANNARSMRFK